MHEWGRENRNVSMLNTPLGWTIKSIQHCQQTPDGSWLLKALFGKQAVTLAVPYAHTSTTLPLLITGQHSERLAVLCCCTHEPCIPLCHTCQQRWLQVTVIIVLMPLPNFSPLQDQLLQAGEYSETRACAGSDVHADVPSLTRVSCCSWGKPG